MLRKPFYEKGQGMILPQCVGPLIITKLVDQHNAVLSDPLMQEPYQDGRYVATGRLAVFKFPTQWLQEDMEDMLMENQDFEKLTPGDFCAVDVALGTGRGAVHIAEVLRQYEVGNQVELQLMEVARGERYGPWERRPWTPIAHGKKVVPQAEVLMKVMMKSGALTEESLSKLAAAGCAVGEPKVENALLGRRPSHFEDED